MTLLVKFFTKLLLPPIIDVLLENSISLNTPPIIEELDEAILNSFDCPPTIVQAVIGLSSNHKIFTPS